MITDVHGLGFKNNGDKFTFYKDWCGFPMTSYDKVVSVKLVSETVKKLFFKQIVNKIVIERKLTNNKLDIQEAIVADDEINNAKIAVEYIQNFIDNIQKSKEELEKEKKLTEERAKIEALEKERLSKEKAEAEEERKNGKNRYSKAKFFFFDIEKDMFLKYSYYDVKVRGTDFKEFDITKIKIDKDVRFVAEPDNEYDKKAIIVIYEDTQIGYIPKNNLQDMIHRYSNDNEYYIKSFVSKVNEDLNEIQIALGFYKNTESEIHIDGKLTKTSKKDWCDVRRQENLECLSEGDMLTLEYDYDSETYVVTDDYGNEVGELTKSKSTKLLEHEEDGEDFTAYVKRLDYNNSDKMICEIRVIIK